MIASMSCTALYVQQLHQRPLSFSSQGKEPAYATKAARSVTQIPQQQRTSTPPKPALVQLRCGPPLSASSPRCWCFSRRTSSSAKVSPLEFPFRYCCSDRLKSLQYVPRPRKPSHMRYPGIAPYSSSMRSARSRTDRRGIALRRFRL